MMFLEWNKTARYLYSRYKDIPFPSRPKPGSVTESGIICLQPFYFAEITTNGDIYTCCPGWIRFPIGNIKSNTIAEIWNSSRARYIRKKLYKGEWRNVCNSICPRISEYNHDRKLIPYDCLESFDFLTPQLISELQRRKEYLDSPPTVFNLSNSTVCNLSCIMCDRHNQHDDPQVIQKTAQDVYSYLPTARRLVLTGMGDPLARPDTRRLLMEFKSQNPDFAFDIITNGLLLPRYWDQIKHQKFCSLQISVDASKKETYEKIRIGGSWNELLKSLDKLQENKDKFSSITLNMTVMQYNYRELPEFINLAEYYGFNVSFQRIRGHHSQNFFQMKDDQVLDELKIILKNEQCKRRHINIFWEDLVEFMNDNVNETGTNFEDKGRLKDEKMYLEEPAETEKDKDSIVSKVMKDAPLFHDDGIENLITWFSNTNLLTSLEKLVSPGMRTIETGSGYSTIVFLSMQCLHTCIVPIKEEIERIKEYCSKTGISLDGVEFIINESHNVLPSYPGRGFDLFFLDGAHRFPFPIIDWFFGARLLKENGLMVVDDTDIVSCHILCRFMCADSHWEPVQVKENFGIFKKLGSHDYPSDWQGQMFSRNKIANEKSILDILSPIRGFSETDK